MMAFVGGWWGVGLGLMIVTGDGGTGIAGRGYAELDPVPSRTK